MASASQPPLLPLPLPHTLPRSCYSRQAQPLVTPYAPLPYAMLPPALPAVVPLNSR